MFPDGIMHYNNIKYVLMGFNREDTEAAVVLLELCWLRENPEEERTLFYIMSILVHKQNNSECL